MGVGGLSLVGVGGLEPCLPEWMASSMDPELLLSADSLRVIQRRAGAGFPSMVSILMTSLQAVEGCRKLPVQAW